MVCHKHKLLFVHVPKTGGHAIEQFFGAWQDKKNGKPGKKPKRYMLVGFNVEHSSLEQILSLAPGSKDYFKFAFVRNPWDKLVSEYFYMVQKNRCTPKAKQIIRTCKNFEGFVRKNGVKFCWKGHATHQHKFFAENSLDFVGRFENFQEDFNVVCKKIGIEESTLPVVNSSQHRNYADYYNKETEEIVRRRYAVDIERFGYKFEK